MKEQGIIYILTNASLKDDCVKIGTTTKSITEELKDQNNASNYKEPFECYAYCESENPEVLKNELDKILLHTNGSLTEDFEIYNKSPEKIYTIIKPANKSQGFFKKKIEFLLKQKRV